MFFRPFQGKKKKPIFISFYHIKLFDRKIDHFNGQNHFRPKLYLH